jgi:hypothetical protein
MLQPGGILNSQTTDTQYFGFEGADGSQNRYLSNPVEGELTIGLDELSDD